MGEIKRERERKRMREVEKRERGIWFRTEEKEKGKEISNMTKRNSDQSSDKRKQVPGLLVRMPFRQRANLPTN